MFNEWILGEASVHMRWYSDYFIVFIRNDNETPRIFEQEPDDLWINKACIERPWGIETIGYFRILNDAINALESEWFKRKRSRR